MWIRQSGPKHVDLLQWVSDPRDFSNAKKIVTIKTNEIGYLALERLQKHYLMEHISQ